MKTYTVAELKTNASRILRSKERAVITRHGKPCAMIVHIEPADLEWSLRPEVQASLERAAKDKAAGRVMSLSDYMGKKKRDWRSRKTSS